ncbi:hypothetical protein PAXINDRAFT_169749 [Paxillus involutus ATCC 200175]|uniref:Uncharacterized protein n=1 Tax=Paxillus involutus ATCC 200175 TaxID=664439 RepID=A0A0C9U652_PAXIN|nr:hypothetical protein PAXINDRAFT_169749 [Paxillus involutus ATCC 200175]
MKHEHMEEEDRIFLEQLKALQLDHVLTHDLERCRERMTRAAAETNDRTKEHEERDREAAKLWVEGKNERQEEEAARALAALRQKELEDGIRRREEERQRAHEEQERKIREEQERLFREEAARKAKEEKHRKYQEERHRKLREARERLLQEERERIEKEERERQAQLRAGQVRRDAPVTPPDGNIVQQFTIYEAKWDELRNNNSLPPIDVSELPWPVLGGIRFMEQITYEAVRTFIFYPDRPSVEGKSARDKVKAEVLRFHPDKFNTRVVPKVQPSQQAVAREIAGAVTRILTSIMTEEMDKEKSV